MSNYRMSEMYLYAGKLPVQYTGQVSWHYHFTDQKTQTVYRLSESEANKLISPMLATPAQQ